MVVRAHVRNGKIELDEAVTLPEGAAVELNVVESSPAGGTHRPIEEVIDEIVADVPESEWAKLPPDLTDQLDYYVYGTPKQ